MLKLILKNTKEIPEDKVQEAINFCNERAAYYQNYFTNYSKDLNLEVIFNHSSLFKVSASLNMKTKKLLLAKEDKSVMKALTSLFSDFKKTVKKHYELEKKEYEYKRKRIKK